VSIARATKNDPLVAFSGALAFVVFTSKLPETGQADETEKSGEPEYESARILFEDPT
jgi:hypothetical protein